MHAQYQARAGGAWSDIRGHLDFIYSQAVQLACYPPDDELSGMARAAVLAELGVRAGNSTCALLAAIETAGAGDLYSVDLGPADVPDAWRRLPYWHFLQADDLSVKARRFIPGELDLLFIDTSHSEPHTLAELAAYAPRVRPGGIILCHDTQWDEGDAELAAPAGPVARALNTWTARMSLEWDNRPGSYGLGVIRVPRRRRGRDLFTGA
jgi:Methyltransferase domain